MKLDRLLGIITVLLQNDRTTAPYLAEKFEVSRRTISRDIDTLCQAGIPIITHQGAGGGISIAKAFKLDNAAVVSLSEPVVIDLASHYKAHLTAKIETIKQAAIEKQIIAFDYYYEKGESRRQIEPYMVVFQWSSWYVFGFCLERMDWRMFKLNRLWNLTLSGIPFELREIPPEKRDFNNHFSEDIKLVALFDKSVKYQLIEAYGLDCYHETDAGLHFKTGFTNRSYMIHWLLGFGAKVKVLAPDDIAIEIQTISKDILSLYL